MHSPASCARCTMCNVAEPLLNVTELNGSVTGHSIPASHTVNDNPLAYHPPGAFTVILTSESQFNYLWVRPVWRRTALFLCYHFGKFVLQMVKRSLQLCYSLITKPAKLQCQSQFVPRVSHSGTGGSTTVSPAHVAY